METVEFSKELLFTEKIFKSGKDALSFNRFHIWEPKTRLPSKLTWFCLFCPHHLSILSSVPTRILTVCQHSHEHVHVLPLFLKESLFHRFSPRSIRPPDSANHGVTQESISHSACAGRDTSIYWHWGMTHMQPIYRNDQDSIKTSKYARCQALCLQREQSDLKGICNYCSLCKWEF